MVMSRLDYFIVARNMENWTEDMYTSPGFRSDHCVLGVVLCPVVIDRARGCWKLNTTLLDDEQYVVKMKEKWKLWLI